VNFYDNAKETEQAANVLFDAGIYRQSVYMACLAVELYLKSKLHLVEHNEDLEFSHDVINLYRALLTRYQPQVNMDSMITKCRKYMTESRYPYSRDVNVFTEEFACEFLNFVTAVKDFVDNDCLATMDDLLDKYTGSNK